MQARFARLAVFLAGTLFLGSFGWILLGSGLGRDLTRFSYDLPFAYRSAHPQDIVIIYMTDPAARELRQTSGIWRRQIHAQLIRRLTLDQPRAILFDVVFNEPSLDPSADPDLADAMQASGRVYLAGQLDLEAGQTGPLERVFPPLPMFRRVAAAWGLVAFRPVDEDYGIRFLYTGNEQVPSATWRMAAKLGAPLPEDYVGRAEPRWVNYYGVVDGFPHFAYDVALDPQLVPPGYFKDKVVVIGGRSSLGVLGLGKDDFRHPLTRWTHAFIPGPEVQATIFANLLNGDWLRRIPDEWETVIIFAFAALLAGLLPLFPPIRATFAAVLIAALTLVAAFWLHLFERTWFTWAIPVIVQTPLGLGWSVGSRYFLGERRRSAFRRAFAAYLSPHLAARMDTAELSLAPGGTVVETSIIFTDLEGFTALSEELADPVKLSAVLTHYFTRTTAHVLENDGTIIKYIGDSVFAVWGAPLADSKHATKAARTACRMYLASERKFDDRVLRTRIGVHTGRVLAGNLGSLQRFDYTCIGDPVNFASRLESLNKQLGTSILISEDTFQRLDPTAFRTRLLGRFRVVGKRVSAGIYELLGEKAPADSDPAWLATFGTALEAYLQHDLARAHELFQRTSQERGLADGPSTFYLKRLVSLQGLPLDGAWDPIIELTSK